MHECVYVRTHVCMYVCVYACMYVCMYVCMCVWVCMCMYVCLCVCTYVSMHACVCMHVSIYVCEFVCMYVCVCVCICMYVRMYVCMYVCMHVCMVASPAPLPPITMLWVGRGSCSSPGPRRCVCVLRTPGDGLGAWKTLGYGNGVCSLCAFPGVSLFALPFRAVHSFSKRPARHKLTTM